MKSQVSLYLLISKTSFIIWQNMENNICNQISIHECVAANEIKQRIYGVFKICLIISYFCDPAPLKKKKKKLQEMMLITAMPLHVY